MDQTGKICLLEQENDLTAFVEDIILYRKHFIPCVIFLCANKGV